MIQQISAPPSVTPTPDEKLSATTVPAVQSSAPTAAISKYEQTQKFLKDRILAVQLKSRNLKDTERKMLIQSVTALGGSFVLCVVYLFLVFPLLIRFAGNLSNLSVFPQTDSIAPRVPAFSAPPEATQESSITLEGFAEPKSKVVLIKNGQEGDNTEVNDEGAFSMQVNLDEGENTLALYSIDEAKNESSVGKEYKVVFDKTAPEVDWQTPEDQKTVKNLREQTIDVKGKANERTKIYLNDQFISASSDGEFSTTFLLQQGENKLTLKVVDEAGNETSVERIVFFKP